MVVVRSCGDLSLNVVVDGQYGPWSPPCGGTHGAKRPQPQWTLIFLQSCWCFGPLNAHNSAHRAATKLRIEPLESLQCAWGREIGFKAWNETLFFTIVLAFRNSNLAVVGPLNGRSSAHRTVPELRIELPESLQRAWGPEIGLRGFSFD